MYERMLDKSNKPTEEVIREYIGTHAWTLVQDFEQELRKRYVLDKAIVFPFGSKYGWGYKYSYKAKHLCHLFFEKEAFTILIQISGKDKHKLESIFDECLPKSREIWEHRYPCGDGGWMYYRVMSKEEIIDVIKFIEIKKRPIEEIYSTDVL